MGMKTRKARSVVYTKAKLACGAGVNWQARAQYFLISVWPPPLILMAAKGWEEKEICTRASDIFPAPLAEGHFAARAPIEFCSALSAPFCYFQCVSAGLTPFCDMFWRGMKENDKSTTISSSVDTRGVCWPLGWGYVNDQSANKTRTKPENLKFEIWFTEDQDVQMN